MAEMVYFDDVLEGYIDGLRDERGEVTLTNRSAAYIVGWRNGRDDRLQQPRASAETIRSELVAALEPSTGER